jgi:hypothetical protein
LKWGHPGSGDGWLFAGTSQTRTNLTAIFIVQPNCSRSDSTIQKLADKGNGNYAYLDSFEEACATGERHVDDDREGRENPGGVQSGARRVLPVDWLREAGAAEGRFYDRSTSLLSAEELRDLVVERFFVAFSAEFWCGVPPTVAVPSARLGMTAATKRPRSPMGLAAPF